MALPKSFLDSQTYLEECVVFFREYQFLYKYANTDILVEGVLDNLEIRNLDKLNVFAKGFEMRTAVQRDIFLNKFFKKLKKLKATHNEFIEDKVVDSVSVPLSSKKQHEIVYVAKEIENICKESGCKTVVDFGSGLGYLDQLLYEKTKYRVLGLECNKHHYSSAKERQRKYHRNSLNNVKYFRHTVNENSNVKIEEYLRETFEDHGAFCITGLHACADLTVDAVNLFLKMADANSLLMMPCCYHKMEVDLNDRFKNFPLSNCLKDIFEKYKSFQYMNVPFMRLAAQPPCRCTDNLEDLVFNLMARAVLEVYANKRNYKLKRKKQKAVRTKNMDYDFDTYIEYATINGYSLIDKNCYKKRQREVSYEEFDFDMDELRYTWRQISLDLTFEKAAMFILLQKYLQPVVENFVLYDRLMYLKENGVEKCEVKRIVSEKISARCLALIACK